MHSLKRTRDDSTDVGSKRRVATSPVVINDAAIIWLNNEPITYELYLQLCSSVARKLEEFTSDNFDACLSYIKNPPIPGLLLVLIVHNQYVDQLLAISLPHVISIYVIGDYYSKRWMNTKVRDVFSINEDIHIIERKLANDFQEYFKRQWSRGSSVFQMNTQTQRAVGELTRENAQFMWYQLLIETLVQMPANIKSKTDLLHQSFLAYADNSIDQEVIHEFQLAYVPNDSITWYTRPSFLFRLLNRACRTLNINIMFSFRFVIRDIQLQLTRLFHEQEKDFQKPFVVYRTSIISYEELDILQRNINGFISRHQFLSTSMKEDVATAFAAGDLSGNTSEVFIFEEISIDPAKCKMKPFANIKEISYNKDEEEVLLSIGTIFRIDSLEKMQDGYRWKMKLLLVDNDDTNINQELHQYLQSSIEPEANLLTLSNFLLSMGHYHTAEEYCKILLKELPENTPDHLLIYSKLGFICQKQGRFGEALEYLNLSINGYENSDHINTHTQRLDAYSYRGLIYKCCGDFDKALSDMQMALRISQDNTESVDLITGTYVHENLGLLYKDNSQYELAFDHLRTALELQEKYLPKNHFSLAQTYNNLSLVLTAMGNHRMGLEYTTKARKIQCQSLPENHPHLATMYQTEATVLYSQSKYSDAFVLYEKAYHIYRSMPHCDPLLEASAISNMGSTLNIMGKYDQALDNFLKALEVQRRIAPNHPNMIKLLNNVAMAYWKKKDTSSSIEYSQQALKMCNETLSENHDLTATTYLILASKFDVDQYDLAMNYFNRILTIYNEYLHLPHHAHVIGCYNRMGIMHRKRREYQQAHQCFAKAIEIFTCAALPERHSLLTQIYINMALTHKEQDDLDQCLKDYQLALEHTINDSPELPEIQNAIETLKHQKNNNGKEENAQ